jgi:hypothetical protein
MQEEVGELVTKEGKVSFDNKVSKKKTEVR